MKKKKAIFTLVACSIAALILIFVLAVGLSQNSFGLKTLMEWDDLEQPGKTPYSDTTTWDPEEIGVDGLDIGWINGKVEIKVGSGDLIRVTETSNREFTEENRLKLSISNGILQIKWSKAFINLSIFENHYKNLVVEVPRALSTSLESLKCSTTAGLISVSGFTAAEQDFSSTSGDLELSSLKGEKASFSSTSGELTMKNLSFSEELSVNTTSGAINAENVESEALNFNTVSGAIAVDGRADSFHTSAVSATVFANLSKCPESVNMSSVSGALVLTIPENPGFEAEYSSVSGDFSSDFPVTGSSGKSGRAKYSAGKSSFRFSTTSGNMQIKKSEK